MDCNLFLYDLGANNHFYIFKWLKNIKRRTIFYDLQKLHEAQISMSINKVVLKHSHTCSLYIDDGYFYATRTDWVVVTETWHAESKYLLSGSL